MDFTQLYYFQTVARTEHVTRAAEKLHISQPALSAVVNRLEKELGVPLFNRIGRNISLNQYGKILLSMTDSVLNEYTHTMEKFSDLQGISSNTLHIAITGLHFSIPIIKQFLSNHPSINITQSLIAAEEIPSALKREQLDFVIGSGENDFDGIASCVLWTEKLMVAVPPSHPLKNRKTAFLKEFSSDKFICLPRSFSFRTFIDKLCMQTGFAPDVAIECFPDQMGSFILQGAGVAIISESTVKHSTLDIYKNALILKDKHCFRTIKLFWNKDLSFRPISRTFYTYILKTYAANNAKTP